MQISAQFPESAAILTRLVYIRQTRVIANDEVYLRRLRKAPYSLSDSRDYWHYRISKVLKEYIGLQVATEDSAVDYGTSSSPLPVVDGLVVTHVDGSLGAGIDPFNGRTLPHEEIFCSKP